MSKIMFDIVMNGNSELYEDISGNFIMVWEKVDNVEGIGDIYNLMEEIPIKNIIDAKKLINEIKKIESFEEYIDSLEEIDEEIEDV